MEDHDGSFTLENKKENGAKAILTFYINKPNFKDNKPQVGKAAE